jgi:hypothetical protein
MGVFRESGWFGNAGSKGPKAFLARGRLFSRLIVREDGSENSDFIVEIIGKCPKKGESGSIMTDSRRISPIGETPYGAA